MHKVSFTLNLYKAGPASASFGCVFSTSLSQRPAVGVLI
jgi:hypothetical protein